MSSGVPGRFIGVFASNSLRRFSSVSTTSRLLVATPPDADRVDPDERRELDGQVAGHLVERGLARGVRHEVVEHQVRRPRRDVDDRARAGGVDHRLRGELAHQERLDDVELHRPLEEALRGHHRRAGAGAAGVVDQDVEPAERRDRRVDEPLAVLLDEDVGDDRDAAPAGLLDAGDDLVEVRLGARADDDVGARLGERDRDAATDPLAAAGDDGDLPVELEARRGCSWRCPPASLANCGAARPAMSGRSR